MLSRKSLNAFACHNNTPALYLYSFTNKSEFQSQHMLQPHTHMTSSPFSFSSFGLITLPYYISHASVCLWQTEEIYISNTFSGACLSFARGCGMCGFCHINNSGYLLACLHFLERGRANKLFNKDTELFLPFLKGN